MNLSRRSLALAGGVALPAIVAGAAVADTPFTTFGFKATGGTTNRTEPDRWADWHNVKDFGAVGNYVADDTAAIQAAINWTASNQRGTIYFPPGLYKVTAPLSIYFGTGANQSIILRGEGNASQLVGVGVNGYIINRYDPGWATPSGTIVIEKLFVANPNETAGYGAIRLGNCKGAVVRDCTITGMNGITLNQAEDNSTYLSNNCSVINCTFLSTGNRTVGSTALNTGNGTTILNFDCSAWDCAIRMCGTGSAMIGGRMEVNNFSIIFGVNQAGTSSPAIACSVGGPTNESFYNTGYDLVYADGCFIYLSGTSTFVGATYGLRLRSGVRNCTIQSSNIGGGFGAAAVSIEDSSGSPGRGNTLIGVTMPFAGWVMPTKARTAHFINCDNPAPIFTFANLPSDPVFGEEFLISNSNVAVSAANFGATVTGGGAITAKVRWNGSNWIIA